MKEIDTVPGLKRILVANRGEIAIRVMRAATELGLRTIAIFSEEDRFSLHRSKADEAYLVGKGKSPVDAYLDIEDVLRIAHAAHADAIHPGYGFLSENPAFAEACEAAGVPLIGPTSDTMRRLGNKISARTLALELARKGVRVNVLLPGLIQTPMTAGLPPWAWEQEVGASPLGRAGRPEEVAQAALFLLSEESAYITGQALYVDGGRSIVGPPGLPPGFGPKGGERHAHVL